MARSKFYILTEKLIVYWLTSHTTYINILEFLAFKNKGYHEITPTKFNQQIGNI